MWFAGFINNIYKIYNINNILIKMSDGALAEWARALHQFMELEIEMDELEKEFSEAKNEREKNILKNRIKMLQDVMNEAEKNEERKWKKYYKTIYKQ